LVLNGLMGRAAAWLAMLGALGMVTTALAQTSPSVGASTSPAAPAPTAAPASPATSAEAVEAGRKLYMGMCARCHGLNLVSSGIGFDLRTFPAHDKDRFARSVTQGLRAMPALGASMTPAQIDQVWGYVGSVNGWPARP
jgi:cytochrome c55X